MGDGGGGGGGESNENISLVRKYNTRRKFEGHKWLTVDQRSCLRMDNGDQNGNSRHRNIGNGLLLAVE